MARAPPRSTLGRPGGAVRAGALPVTKRPDLTQAAQGADALAWLRGACEAATAGPPAAEAATFAAARAEAFPPGAANAYRHLRPHDFSDAVLALPQEEVQARARQAGSGCGRAGEGLRECVCGARAAAGGGAGAGALGGGSQAGVGSI